MTFDKINKRDVNNDEVICPKCSHQFRAIPVNVQRLMLIAGFEPPFKSAPVAQSVPFDAEAVQCYLYALLDEAKRRGGMFPQTSDEQDSDSDAIHRVCEMVKWYGERGHPTQKAVSYKREIRARNMAPKQNGEHGTRTDAERLDFVLSRQLFIHATNTDAGHPAYQLLDQNEDEEFIVVSGEGQFFTTPREAIDAAIAAQGDS